MNNFWLIDRLRRGGFSVRHGRCSDVLHLQSTAGSNLLLKHCWYHFSLFSSNLGGGNLWDSLAEWFISLMSNIEVYLSSMADPLFTDIYSILRWSQSHSKRENTLRVLQELWFDYMITDNRIIVKTVFCVKGVKITSQTPQNSDLQ